MSKSKTGTMYNKYKNELKIHKNKGKTIKKKHAAPFEWFFLSLAVYWLGLRSDKAAARLPRVMQRSSEKGCTEKTG